MKILVVGPSWVGDLVTAQSLFISLKSSYPFSKIDVLALDWVKPLLEFMPEIDEAISMPIGHGALSLGGRWQISKTLRSRKYDWAIILPNSFKSALIPWMAGIPKRTGWLGEMRYGLVNDRRKVNHLDRRSLSMQSYYCGLQEATPENVLPRPKFQVPGDESEVLFDKYVEKSSRPILALCPGAEFGPSKQWPVEHFSKLASLFFNKYKGHVLLFGSPKDSQICEQIYARFSDEHPNAKDTILNFAGELSLRESVLLLAQANAVVSNDSGLMHVSAAIDLPIVAIYGSTDPSHSPALTERKRVHKPELNCSPCFERRCRYGHYDCLRGITPAEVMGSLEKLMSEQKSLIACESDPLI